MTAHEASVGPCPPDAYEDWICRYLRTAPSTDGFGLCKEAAESMARAFPELEVVPGHVETVFWGRRGHWWCRTPDGSIVDPTAAQFAAAGVLAYEPFEPGALVRAGTCMNCGTEIWLPLEDISASPHNPHAPACSQDCLQALDEEYNR